MNFCQICVSIPCCCERSKSAEVLQKELELLKQKLTKVEDDLAIAHQFVRTLLMG